MKMKNNKDDYEQQLIIQTEEFNFQESVLFDKSILTLAGGVFGLSLTFIKQIPHTKYVPLLLVSWILYTVSMLLTLISMLTSQTAIRKKVEYLEANDYSSPYKNPHASWTLRLNICSMLSFIIGTFFLLCFVFRNLH
jgi:hypothetical protein